MSIFDKLFDKQKTEKSKDMSYPRIYEAIVNIAKDNECYIYMIPNSHYICVPLKYKHVVETYWNYRPADITPSWFLMNSDANESSLKLSQEKGEVNGYLAVFRGIPISFSEDAHTIEYVDNNEKLKNDSLSSLL